MMVLNPDQSRACLARLADTRVHSPFGIIGRRSILEVVTTHLSIIAIALQTFETPIREVLARVIKLACSFTAFIKSAKGRENRRNNSTRVRSSNQRTIISISSLLFSLGHRYSCTNRTYLENWRSAFSHALSWVSG